ncbi:MAG TPA: hypothetical protein VFK36_09890 [Gemmatimonadales bacterium]|nr:hypothetical protein [Gemmatimonadales bacterium]
MGAKRRVARVAELKGPTPREWQRLKDNVDALLEWAAVQHQLDLATCAMASTTKPPPPPKFRLLSQRRGRVAGRFGRIPRR